MKYIFIFIGIVVLKFLMNIVNYFNGFKLEKIWDSFHVNKDFDNISYISNIQKYFKNAKIKSSNIKLLEPVGLGHAHETTYDFYDNIFLANPDIMRWVNQSFAMARGFYRNRAFESFNPFYWVDFIIKLPKYFIEYLGLDTETIFTKIFQTMYWIIDSVLIVYYREPIFDFIQEFISKLFK